MFSAARLGDLDYSVLGRLSRFDRLFGERVGEELGTANTLGGVG